MWRLVSQCRTADLESRCIDDVALRTDGRFALIFSPGDSGVVWDVQAGCVKRFLDTHDVQTVDRYLERQGFLNVNYGAGAGKYRMLGFHDNFSLPEHQESGLGIAVDGVLQKLTLYDMRTGKSVLTLPHDSIDADAVIVSFSDDGKTFAVVERSYAAFYSIGEIPVE